MNGIEFRNVSFAWGTSRQSAVTVINWTLAKTGR